MSESCWDSVAGSEGSGFTEAGRAESNLKSIHAHFSENENIGL